MPSASVEDYIKVIHALESEHRIASTKLIAEQLGVTPASVTGMAKSLANEGYVRHTPYRGIRLTEKGRRIAARMLRRHRLLELFLSKVLGLSWDEIHEDAERLEHVVSETLVDRIDDFLERPEFDPHGSPIPPKGGGCPPRRGIPLNELPIGRRARIAEVADADAEFLRYLSSLNVAIGTEVVVLERAPYNGPVTLQIGADFAAIGLEAGKRIRVCMEEHLAG